MKKRRQPLFCWEKIEYNSLQKAGWNGRCSCMNNRYYQIEVIDRTLWVTAYGSSKISVVEAYVRDFRTAASVLVNGAWACVLDLRLWHPSPHETMQLLQDNTRWCYQHGLQLGVAIVPDNPVSAWQYLKATATEAPQHAERYQVKTSEEAQAVLRRAGYLSAEQN